MKLRAIQTLVFFAVTAASQVGFAGQPSVDSPEPSVLALVALGCVPLVVLLYRRIRSQDVEPAQDDR